MRGAGVFLFLIVKGMPTCKQCGAQCPEEPKRRQSKPGDKRSLRGALCHKVMKELGLASIMEASSIVKARNLYEKSV